MGIRNHWSILIFYVDKVFGILSTIPKVIHGDHDYLHTVSLEGFGITSRKVRSVDSQKSYSHGEPDVRVRDVPDSILLESDFPIMGATLLGGVPCSLH